MSTPNHVKSQRTHSIHSLSSSVTGWGQTNQNLAEGFVLQVGQVFCQFTGVQVVEQQGHFPLFGHRWDTLSHLSLPLIRWPDRDDKAHILEHHHNRLWGSALWPLLRLQLVYNANYITQLSYSNQKQRCLLLFSKCLIYFCEVVPSFAKVQLQ